VTTFVSQNYGAGNLTRCHKATRVGFNLTMFMIVVLSALACLFADELLALFNDNPAVISVGRIRIYYIIGFYFLCVFIEILSGALRGYGYSLPPALLMLVTICGVRIAWIYTVFAAEPTFTSIMIAYPVSWTATAVLLIGIYLFYRKNIKPLAPRL
jgi:Na+-driven multidrug efflux pump